MMDVQPFVRICAACKRVQDGAGGWKDPGPAVAALPATCISHGICPTCTSQLYPEIDLAMAKEVHDAL